MTMSRRAFLGATLTGGLMTALGGPPSWAYGGNAVPSDPFVLVDAGVSPSFRAAATRGGHAAVSDGLGTLSNAAAWLAARPGRRVIGLVSEADGVLFRQLVQGPRVRWLALGHHCEGGQGDFHSRHRITALPSSRGLARDLAAGLAAASSDFSVVEVPLGSPEGTLADVATCTPAPASARGWEAILGDALGRIAAGMPPGDSAGPVQAFAGRGIRGPDRNLFLTSFVIGS